MLKRSINIEALLLKFDKCKYYQLKLSGATAHESQGLLCPSHYTGPLGAEVHEQMSGSGGQSEARPSVFKSPSKLGTHLPTRQRNVYLYVLKFDSLSTVAYDERDLTYRDIATRIVRKPWTAMRIWNR
ncbi:uncharacterized protein TNCV_283691 [Trichonephila clavipes]|uniref:Uncharacterized protein n=1 Tax=Trichonephila clavipes TaxID=2585209 RepID=A0A8X6SFF6_TRICX|nr:uncharacterized protein TNCV_283691 [Trichonephila clavipes]